MTKYGAHLLESGTLAQHCRRRGMSQYVRAAKRSLYSCATDRPRYDRRHGTDVEGIPGRLHTNKQAGDLNGRPALP